MSTMNQKTAVSQAISQVLGNAGINVPEGAAVKSFMTKELRAQVNQILFEGFRSGTVTLSVEKNDAELKQYVSGLQSNWLNKDTDLNGGTKYVAKNPGSRKGSTDPQVKALRALLTQAGDESERAEIQGYLDTRLAEIAMSKKSTKSVTIDFDALPAELKSKYEAI